LKSRTYRLIGTLTGALGEDTRHGAAILTVIAALGLTFTTRPAFAQFSNTEGAATNQTTRMGPDGKLHVVYSSRYFLTFSPYTVFQFRDPNHNPQTGGNTLDRSSRVGPFVQIEKYFPLHSTDRDDAATAVAGGDQTALTPPPAPYKFSQQAFTAGAWYWYHGGSDINRDRFALYGKYNYNSQLGAEVNAGGSTSSGFFEYYGFLLYSPPLPPKNKVSLTIGVGPYLPKSSLGNTGFTASLGIAYRLGAAYRLTAGVWYLNYNRPTNELGGGSISESLTRYNLSGVYNF